MNTKFTILVAAGLLIAGVSQAQGTIASNSVDFHNPRHAVVRDHKVKERKEIKQNGHKKHRHHKAMKHHHRKF